MRKRKGFFWIIALLLLAGGITGCGKRTEDAEAVSDMVYVPAYSKYEYCFEQDEDSPDSFTNKFIQGKYLYAVFKKFIRESGMTDLAKCLLMCRMWTITMFLL